MKCHSPSSQRGPRSRSPWAIRPASARNSRRSLSLQTRSDGGPSGDLRRSPDPGAAAPRSRASTRPGRRLLGGCDPGGVGAPGLRRSPKSRVRTRSPSRPRPSRAGCSRPRTSAARCSWRESGRADAVFFTPFNKKAMRLAYDGYDDEIRFVRDVLKSRPRRASSTFSAISGTRA